MYRELSVLLFLDIAPNNVKNEKVDYSRNNTFVTKDNTGL